jgi:transcription initiation factor IIF auxiliary subunit
MLYVRGSKEEPDLSDVVAKVRFLIHQSYHPNNLIEVHRPPFHLTRRGWGEFPARFVSFGTERLFCQLHFRRFFI